MFLLYLLRSMCLPVVVLAEVSVVLCPPAQSEPGQSAVIRPLEELVKRVKVVLALLLPDDPAFFKEVVVDVATHRVALNKIKLHSRKCI